jgi:hypothetical protein
VGNSNNIVRFRFGIRAILFWTTAIALGLALISLKLFQDQRRANALNSLESMGFTVGFAFSDQRLAAMKFHKGKFEQDESTKLVANIEALSSSYNLGFSSGNRVIIVDFADSIIARSTLQFIQRQLPNTEIRSRYLKREESN